MTAVGIVLVAGSRALRSMARR